MSIFDITPAGAYVNAIQAANEKDRLEAARYPVAQHPTERRRPLAAAKALSQAFLRVAKAIASLRPAADLRSRTA